MLEIDVFTLFPHWFAWLSEETAVQRALSGPLSLRFLSYRDYSPLPHAQVDDAPFGGGAGMLMRVDAVASAVEGAYGGDLATRARASAASSRSIPAGGASTTATRASSPRASGSRSCAAATRASTPACSSTSRRSRSASGRSC